MKFLDRAITPLAVTTTLLATTVSLPSRAFTIAKNSNSDDLLSALLGDTTGLSNFSASISGDSRSFGLFEGDPFNLESGVILSTGIVDRVSGENRGNNDFISGSDLSADLKQPGNDKNSFDLAQLDITFEADSTVEMLFFQYVFGSEEFVEFGGDKFNDSFELLLNGENLARLSDGQDVTINNLVPQPEPDFFHPDYIDNPIGENTKTKLDGYTQVLTFEGALAQNSQNTLSIRIKDVSDAVLDSAVLIKSGSVSTAVPKAVTKAIPSRASKSTSVPEPTFAWGLGLLVIFSGMWKGKEK
ncbi:choice-of-anchor L domain-containing protein [Oscillatoriales cyanobacterium LEGE 11467]|uniref:Choice-of-anchor L domain-containing protein n=1 Tax=Zarconia navalis LEGE 11467 TaxID=1828826 RepID=A0A928ZA86_9CYAN|nr:choice-of-anchor L domain-containing protein [Zarconia navalis]MBE9042579.1 choice-of-anchor L domain-containing protein [Zarconia navalis LEGE 11467]